jgi:RimJ/RimL family protein N-acetyltransferase
MDQIIFLEGERLYLRPLEAADLTMQYVQWLNNELVCRHNSHATFPYSKKHLEDYFAQTSSALQSMVVLAIIDRATGKHIGNISLQAIDWVSRSAEFAVLLGDTDFWRVGYSSEAALLICDYGFKRLNLHRIYCGTSSKNTGMQKLAGKLHMRHEGTRRQAMYKLGEYVDILEYGVLRDEFYQIPNN